MKIIKGPFIFVLMMDAVITYVDMVDPVWQEQYKKTFGDEPDVKRFKNLGTIELQVKCIRKFMSWIDQIFIVVSTRSQVKNLDNVTIVTHDQIIPREYLPTFNSCTIEMFLHKIPGLSDYFVYFNDDIFPVDYLDQSEFFDRVPVLSFKHVIEPPQSIYRYQCKNSTNLARLLTQTPLTSDYIKIDHICCVHSKKAYLDIWSRASQTIFKSLSQKRESQNFNQCLFADYLLYSNQCKLQRFNYIYLEYRKLRPADIYNTIKSKNYKLICIQDNVQDDNYNSQLIKGLTEITQES